MNPKCDRCGQLALYEDVEFFRDAAGFYECDACIEDEAAYFAERYPQEEVDHHS